MPTAPIVAPQTQTSTAQQQPHAAAASAAKPTHYYPVSSNSPWRSAFSICVSSIGLIFTIAAAAWAIKSYNATVLANELSQKESCRMHPVRSENKELWAVSD
ncbi:hypothetical protein DE146DRAFT_633224 [Phaeosphaeria sp. MPI-PUGE-AT-0046c]|nr:hypothetical protein DE146DRAFT_633224 [Phaeosphaeria sp. MPI-PUGE-AT-0046c]